MPHVHVKNDTGKTIHVAFKGIPLSYENNIETGTIWTRENMPSLIYAVEVREASGGKPFTDKEGTEKAGQIMGACAAGSASMLVGTVTAMAAARGGSQKGFDVAGGLMNQACDGGKEFGSEYDGHVLRVEGVGIGAEECHYAIHFENDTYRLFDEEKKDHL